MRQHGPVTEAAARSDAPEPERGVKREIATLSRALKKADSAAPQMTPAHSRRRTKAAKVKRHAEACNTKNHRDAEGEARLTLTPSAGGVHGVPV